MRYQFTIFIFLIGFLSGCARIDDMIYDNEKLTSYELENYTGEQDFIVGNMYNIPTDKITKLTFESGAEKYKIYAVYLGNVDSIGVDTVIMYCHGNYAHIDHYWNRLKLMANVGGLNRYGVLVVDYRGFGLSEGEPTEKGMIEDVNAGLSWLKENGLTSERLMIYGFSLGSYPATYLAAKKTEAVLSPSKLMLEAPFASTDVMASDGSLLNMPASFFASSRLNNADLIKEVSQDLFWLHGTADAKLSMTTHGEVVFKNHGGSYKEGHRIEGAEHPNIPVFMGVEEYMDLLAKFIVK